MYKKNRKKLFILLFIFIISIISFSFICNISIDKQSKIDRILLSKEYSYLPKQAKNYIKEVYEKTGQIVLTEKNKKENTPYLNPQYVDYVVLSDDEKKNISVIPMPTVVDYSLDGEEKDEKTLPSLYDLRDVNGKNYVTPVRNQGSLGLCWAFSTAETAESFILKKTDSSYDDSSILISERQIDYAMSINGIKDYRSEYVSFIDRKLGAGGNFYISTIAMANGISLNSYNSFKEYNDKDFSKMELKDVLSFKNSLYEVNSTINMPLMYLRESTDNLSTEELETRESFLNMVKENIMNYGAPYVSTMLGDSNGCMIKDSNNNYVIDDYNCNNTSGHAMQIIGWDDDYEYEYCADTNAHEAVTSSCSKVVRGKGIWILKNSWGDSVQYPYLTYDSYATGINFITDMELSSNKTWENNYILGSEYYVSDEMKYDLSSVNIKNDEIINKIKFITLTSNGTYNVKISKADGTYETISKTQKMPGLITIDIPNNIIINKDTNIIISTDDEYIDKVIIFTSNINEDETINLKLDNKSISDKEIRLYSETKNIDSGEVITYKLYDKENNDVSDKISYTNNEVVENNVNTLITFNGLETEEYKLEAIHNGNSLSSVTFNYEKMKGDGTKSNPYIITNPTQLSQIRDDLDAYYELGNDIDMTEATHDGGNLSISTDGYCPERGFGWESINGFSGTLDGKGYTIKGLYQNKYLDCDNDGKNEVYYNDNENGLFSYTYGNVTIKNLILEDFDINCFDGTCSALLSNYDSNQKNSNDKNVYNANFINIALKNSKISAYYHDHKTVYGGGLFGSAYSAYGAINVSNIYLDYNLETKNINDSSYLFKSIQAKNINVENILLQNNLRGNNSKLLISLVVPSYTDEDTIEIKNILSTTTGNNVKSLFGQLNEITNLKNINMLKIEDEQICYNSSSCSSNISNMNIFNKQTQLGELTKIENYNTWEDFDDNWVIKTIDGVPRIPVLKFLDFDYTEIKDIDIDLSDNNTNLYDYIYPTTTKEEEKIIYSLDEDEDVIQVDEEGNIETLKIGKTKIHIESLHDGYIGDINVSVSHSNSHYIVNYDSNGGVGKTNKSVVDIGDEFIVSKCNYTRENYNFVEWNTKKDGTGKKYKSNDIVNLDLKDGDSITLYAIWKGYKSIITFDPNGGSITSTTKEVYYGEKIGDIPIPTKAGCGFKYWVLDNLSIPMEEISNQEAGYYPDGITYKAYWAENAYTIVFNSNEAKGYKYTTYAKNGIDTSLLENKFTKEGYKFKEWNTKASGDGISYSETDIINLSNVENNLLNLYAIWQEEYSYIINKYKVDEDNKYIDKIDINTTVDNFKKNIDLNIGYSIDVNYKTIENKNLLYTGSKTKIYKNNNLIIEYTNIIRGEVTGDAKINYLDYVNVYNHIQKVKHPELDKKELKNEYLISADMSGDGKVNYLDYVQIYNKIKELKGEN